MVTPVPKDETAAGTITIVLADDHEVVRSGLRMVLEAEDGFEVVAEAGDLDARAATVGAPPQGARARPEHARGIEPS